MFVLDNMNSARMPDSSRLDVKKLGDMWKSLEQSERDVSLVVYMCSLLFVCLCVYVCVLQRSLITVGLVLFACTNLE